jgi:hypothetical protein
MNMESQNADRTHEAALEGERMPQVKGQFESLFSSPLQRKITAEPVRRMTRGRESNRRQ